MYFSRGLYAHHVWTWLERFPQEQLLFLFTEDLASNPEETSRSIFCFLYVRDDGPVDSTRVHNAAFALRSRWVARVM